MIAPSEYKSKLQMAERLNLLMNIEPSFVLQLVSTYHVVTGELGKTHFVTEAPTKDTPEALINVLGILNGLVGENKWHLSLNVEGQNPRFEVTQVVSESYINHERKPYLKLTKSKTGE